MKICINQFFTPALIRLFKKCVWFCFLTFLITTKTKLHINTNHRLIVTANKNTRPIVVQIFILKILSYLKHIILLPEDKHSLIKIKQDALMPTKATNTLTLRGTLVPGKFSFPSC